MLEASANTTCHFVQGNKENVIFIWFESTIDTNDEIGKNKESLRLINNSIRIENNIDSCITAMKSTENKKKIFLIISGNDASQLLSSTVHNLRQIDSIFIFPGKQDEFNYLFENFNKIVNIFSSQDEFLKSIKENLTDVEKQIEIFSFYDQRQQATRDLSEESAKFLWFQLFNDAILHLPRDDEAKDEMIRACRLYYRDNRKVLTQINEFGRYYDKNKCIEWYTRDAFVYRLINKALRTEDIEQLYTFRYYIADLSNQLKHEYQTIKKGLEDTIKLYRGMTMTRKEAETLKANEGKLIAINGYWSTSRSRSYALTYVDEHMNDANTTAVLFEIECDLQDEHNSVIFADIVRFSAFPEEQEVLFDVGAVFKIEKVSEEQRGKTNILVIKKKTTGEGREIAKQFIEENRKEMDEESPTIMFCTLLKRMEKSEKSLKFLERLLKNPGNENIAHIHNRIGIAHKDENKYDLALSHFQKAFELTYDSNPPQRKYAAFVLHNKGLVHAKRKQFDQALDFYRRAISVLEREIGPENCGIAQFYNSIGRAYRHQERYDDAHDYQEKSLKIRERCLPADHVIIAFNYMDIGDIYSHKKNYKQAQIYHRKALDLRKKYLPPDHHTIAWSLHRVGRIYYKMRNQEDARYYYLQSLEIQRKSQSKSLYSSIPGLLEDIAKTYDFRSEEALKHRLEALEIQRKIEPIDDSVLIYRLDKLASTCESINNLNDSLKYYEEALEIQRQMKPINYSDLAYRLDRIAFTYKSLNRLNDSLKTYKEALEIRETHLSDDQWHLACSFKNLAAVFEKKGENAISIDYYHKALNNYHGNYPHDHRFCQDIWRNINRVKRSINEQRMYSNFSEQMNMNE